MFIRGCRRCMLARSLVLQCRSAFLFASCEMLRDITRGTKVTRCRIIVVKCFLSFFFLFFFFFFVLFVCVSILQSSWMITLSVPNVGSGFYVCYYFLFFFFFVLLRTQIVRGSFHVSWFFFILTRVACFLEQWNLEFDVTSIVLIYPIFSH